MSEEIERIPNEEENRDAYLKRLKHKQVREYIGEMPCPACGSVERSNSGECVECGADVEFLITVELIEQRDDTRDMLVWAAAEAERGIQGIHARNNALKVITARIFDFFKEEV